MVPQRDSLMPQAVQRPLGRFLADGRHDHVHRQLEGRRLRWAPAGAGPEASGSPNSIFWQMRPVTLPSAPITASKGAAR